MTLLAAIVTSDGEIAFVADSIETTTDPASFVIGTTTHNEAIQPIVQGNQIWGFTEGACKIGTFGDTLVGVAGNASLIYEIVGRISTSLPTWVSTDDVDAAFAPLLTGIFGQSLIGSSAILNFAFRSSTDILFCSVSVSVRDDQTLLIANKTCIPVVQGKGWSAYFGSGARLVQGYYPQDPTSAYHFDRTLKNLFPSMLTMDLSAKVRTEQMNQACGVGGVFISAMLTSEDLVRSTDVFHIHADANNLVHFFCKVLFRRGTYFVNDIIGRRAYAMRSLEEEVAFRIAQRPGTIDVTAEVLETLQIQAKGILLDVRSPTDPSRPNVRIVENKNGAAVTGLEMVPMGAYPQPGTPISFSTRTETLNLTVRP